MAFVKEMVELGRWSLEEIEGLIKDGARIDGSGRRVDFLSGGFLGVPYREGTLVGSEKVAEVMVINFAAVDCFTLLDYVEAMRRSQSFQGFRENLRRVRYRGGSVTFADRNHFFAGWREGNAAFIDDVTTLVAAGRARRTIKVLNRKGDGSLFLPGISPFVREITYIDSGSFEKVQKELRPGDYVGIFSETPGLDVSHVGIVVRRGGKALLRHASSGENVRCVTEEDLGAYLSGKPGIVVFRARDCNRWQT